MSSQTRLTMEEIKAYRGQGEGRRSGEHLRFYCPVHGSDNQRSLSLDPETGRFRCFACGAWGYLEEKRQEWIEERKKEARENRKKGFRGRKRLPDPTGSGTGGNTKRAEANTEKAADRAEKLQKVLSRLQEKLPGSPGEEYLEKRGIPLELAQKYGVGYAPYGEWPHRNRKGKPVRQWNPGRVVFPHSDSEDRVVNLYGRAAGDDVPKDKRHDHLPESRGVFNAQALSSGGRVFICEGVFDALSLVAAGQEHSCAIFGVDGLRWDWVGARQVVFCMDPDEGGSRWRELAREGLLRGKEIYFLPEEVYAGYEDLNALWMGTGQLDVGGWEQPNEEWREAEEQEAARQAGQKQTPPLPEPIIDSQCRDGFPQKEPAQAYIIKSELLDGELIALVRHTGLRLPYKYRSLPRYTFDEMRTLLETGIEDPEMLWAVHEVKKEFDGMTRILPARDGQGRSAQS